MNTPWPFPKLIAHRGGGTLAPENTLASMRKGHELGYQAVEFDVKLSEDNVAILHHDPTLGRTVNGAGEIKNFTYAELAKLDAGGWHSAAYAGERIPRFADVADYLNAKRMLANVEIKPCPGREDETGERIALACRKLWAGQPVLPLLTSFSYAALVSAMRVAPELPRGLLVKDFEDSHWTQLSALDAVSLNCRHVELDATVIQRLHDKGYRVMTYTVNDEQRVADLLAAGVDGIFTDNLEVMRKRFPKELIGKTNQAN